MTLEQLKAQRAALQKARRTGVARVRNGDQSVEYRSDAEIKTALADLEREIAEAEGRPTVKRIRRVYVSGKGY